MTKPFYFGGMTPYRTGWLGPRAVYVDFLSEYTSGWLFQLYAGRRLIGATASPRERRVSGQLLVEDAPCPLTLLRVRPGLRWRDFSSHLPRLAWNRYVLQWQVDAYPPDAKAFEITSSRIAGEPVDPSHVLALVPYAGNRQYEFPLPPIASSGVWVYRLTPRDDAEPSGNAGDSVDVTIDAVVPPADVRLDDAGQRFSLEVVDGELTATFHYRT